MDVGGFTCFDQGLLGNVTIRHTQEDVLANRALIQRCVLRYKPDGRAVGLHVQSRQRSAVDQNLAGCDVIEAFKEGDDGGLAATRGADDADCLAVVDLEVQASEDWELGPGRVGESDVSEFDCGFCCVVRSYGVSRGAIDRWFLFSKMQDLVCCCVGFSGIWSG